MEQWSVKYAPSGDLKKEFTSDGADRAYNDPDDDETLRRLLWKQGLGKYAEQIYGEWEEDSEGSEFFIPGQDDEDRDYYGNNDALEHAVDDYAYEPTAANKAALTALGKSQHKFKREEDFRSSPTQVGVIKEVVLPPLSPKEKQEDPSPVRTDVMTETSAELMTRLQKLTEMMEKQQSIIREQQSKLDKLHSSISAKAPVSKSDASGSKKSGKQKPTVTSPNAKQSQNSSEKQKNKKPGPAKSSPNGDGHNAVPTPK
jgi:hypothetical protein